MALTKEQARAPRRKTESLTLPEFDAPLLLAYPSARLALSLRERKLDFTSEAALTEMVADMVVGEDGARIFTTGEATDFFGGISAESLTALMRRCFEMQTPGGASGNSKPSTSAA